MASDSFSSTVTLSDSFTAPLTVRDTLTLTDSFTTSKAYGSWSDTVTLKDRWRSDSGDLANSRYRR